MEYYYEKFKKNNWSNFGRVYVNAGKYFKGASRRRVRTYLKINF